MQEALAWIGLGGNLGDVPATLARARAALERLGTGPLRASGLYGSTAWPTGTADQPDHVNQVVGLPTRLPPQPLLEALLALESELGRVRGERWGPRVVDLDLLAWDFVRMETPTLTLPHPRLAERRFVLLPWSEVAPDFRVAGPDRTVAELLAACPDPGRVWPWPS